MKRKRNLYFGFGKAKPKKRELTKSRREFKSGVEHRRRRAQRGREKEQSTLFQQLQKDAKPQRARQVKMSPRDEALWSELLRANPRTMTAEQISELGRLGKIMAGKKRKRKKNSRKSKMPAGLRKYWAKKRAKKAKRKNPKKRRRVARRNPPRRKPRVRRRRRVSLRVKNYRRPRRKANRRRRPAARRAGVKIVKAPYGMSGKRLQAFRREQAAKYGAPARIIKP